MSRRIIDLTLAYQEGMPGYRQEISHQFEKEGWNARLLELYSHAGTHMDAPFHFDLEGTIDQVPLDACMGEAWVVDLPDLPDQYLIGTPDLGDLADRIRPGDMVLFRTGWSHYLGMSKYRNGLPRISTDLAQWLVDQKVGLIGVEGPSVADVNNREEVTQIHRILLRGGVIIVEGLTNLEAIRREKVGFIALPLKIHQGDGAPCRALAIETTYEAE